MASECDKCGEVNPDSYVTLGPYGLCGPCSDKAFDVLDAVVRKDADIEEIEDAAHSYDVNLTTSDIVIRKG